MRRKKNRIGNPSVTSCFKSAKMAIYRVRSPKSMPSNRSIDLRSLTELESNFVLSKMNIYVTVEDNPCKMFVEVLFFFLFSCVSVYVLFNDFSLLGAFVDETFFFLGQ